MRGIWRLYAVLISATYLAGCAIHPLPEDVTGVKTIDIVRSIRCEARDALRGKIIAFLDQVGGDPAATKYGALLRGDPALWAKFNDRWFSPPVTAILRKFEGSAIAYNFALDMTEVNNLDPTVDLTNPTIVPFGAFTTPLTGGVDRSRENARTFTITDTWINLIQTLDEVYCAPYAHIANYIYPITGRIGIDEMIDTFVDLSLFDNLAAPATASGKPPTMADDLVFTTLLSFGATPKLTFIPFSKGLSVADADLGIMLSRKDKHEVTVGLSLPPSPAAVAAGGSRPNQLVLTASGGPAQQAAAQAVEQSITRFQLLGKTAVVVAAP